MFMPPAIGNSGADLAAHREQVGGGVFDLAQDRVQRVLGNRGVVMQRGEQAFLPLQFLQQFGLQVRAAGDFEDFE